MRSSPPEPTPAPSPTGAPGRPPLSFPERAKELDFEHRRYERGVLRVVLTLTFLRRLWRRWWGRTLSAQAAPVPRPPGGTLALTFVGHGTLMLTTATARVLTDPVLESALWGLRRVRAAAIDTGDLCDVDLILISRPQRDHLSRRTLAALPRSATLVLPPGCAARVADLRFSRVVQLEVGQTFGFQDLDITAVPVGPGTSAGAPSHHRAGANGYVVRAQGRTVYFAGDTGYFAGFTAIGDQFSPDVAVLPIAGYQPAPLRRAHLSPLGALYAFQDLGARILVPSMHGSFDLGAEPIDEPLKWMRALGAERGLGGALTVLDHGQTCLIR